MNTKPFVPFKNTTHVVLDTEDKIVVSQHKSMKLAELSARRRGYSCSKVVAVWCAKDSERLV